MKFALDRCLKEEKQNLLKVLNKDVEQKRQIEENAYQQALGKDISFDEYLRQDKDYIRATNRKNNK